MDRNLTWKWILIIAVLLLSAFSLWPPAQTLKPSIDLAGGTSLLYEVDVTGEDDPEEVMRRAIRVLSRRVDPAGVMNLVWRIEAGNRIEIQMPLAARHVGERLRAYQDQLDQIEAANIGRAELDAALGLQADARGQALEAMVRGVEPRRPLLQEAATAYDELAAARAVYQKALDDADARIEAAGRVAAAERRFDRAVAAVMGTNLDRAEVGPVLELETQARRIKGVVQVAPREQAIGRLVERYPHRADEIHQLVAAFDAYREVKTGLDDPNDLIRLLRGAGVLEFRIAASEVDVPNASQLRAQLAERGPRAVSDGSMRWFVIDDLAEWADNPVEMQRLHDDPGRYFAETRGLVAGEYGGQIYLLLWDTLDRSLTDKSGRWQLSSVRRDMDERGFPAVGFELDELGGSLMGSLTGGNVGRPMAIVLDGRVYSTPRINSQIHGRGIITGGRGGFNQQELEYLIRTLGAGSLKAKLSEAPISIRNIGPALGLENRQRGMAAARDALILVAAFMLLYYFLGGFVANIALLANIVIILGVMALLDATFTLPGIAGIVLTIGMCVDANVLVFERIREELRRGADMLTSLRLGYQKAFSAIFDGNLTNLIICLILGYTATADVKGFAVTLGIGIVATLFTSVFMSRVIFLTYYKIFGVKRMKMLPTVFPGIDRFLTPNFDWVGKRKLFFTVSGVLIVGSLVLVSIRGQDMLDIEFRAGTEVSFDLTSDQRLSQNEVEQRLDGTALRGATVVTVGDVDAQYRAAAFSVMTTQTDAQQVAEIIRTTFADVIDVPPTIAFAAMDAQNVATAPVYPLTSPRLGQAINRPGVEVEVPEFVGGAAIVLDNLTPSLSTDAVAQRIRTMRFQPDYADLQFRSFRVVPLTPDPAQPQLYRSVAVVVSDPATSYFDDADTWEARLAATEWNLIRDAMQRETSLSKVSNFTPTVAQTMRDDAIVSLLLSFVAIIAYIWFRFGSLRYGLASIVALVHDVVIALGLVALSGFVYHTMFGHALLLDPFRINMALIAALLTIVGYSLNDTIVIFDRIRENRGKLANATPGIINDSINQTISRTAITSGTTLMAVLMLYIDGGPGIHAFAFAMFVGVLIGTYSSVAIAAPLLLVGIKGGRSGSASTAGSPTQLPRQPLVERPGR